MIKDRSTGVELKILGTYKDKIKVRLQTSRNYSLATLEDIEATGGNEEIERAIDLAGIHFDFVDTFIRSNRIVKVAVGDTGNRSPIYIAWTNKEKGFGCDENILRNDDSIYYAKDLTLEKSVRKLLAIIEQKENLIDAENEEITLN